MTTSSPRPHHSELLPNALSDALILAANEVAAEQRRGVHSPPQRKSGVKGETLHPGPKTPLWNTLVDDVRPWLGKRGAQANLARILGLQRQQVNAFFTQRSRMPDAERTLQILAWVIAARKESSGGRTGAAIVG